jgi:UDP-N-acetylmuramoyl-tripeptide--D-alanyl-D-alanine ligase
MNHPGEIAPLARLSRLDVALITTIAPAHLEAFNDLNGIAAEKASIFQGLEPGGTAIVPLDPPTAPLLLAEAQRHAARILTFGTRADTNYHLAQVTVGNAATIVRATRQGTPTLYKVMSPGKHFAANGLAVLAVADALGLDPAIAATDLGRWSPPAGRGTRERIALDPVENLSFDLIDDAFNSNPASLAAALDVLIAANPQDQVGRISGGRRIAVLGDMLELGPTETDLHLAVARHPGLSQITTIHCVGPRMAAFWQALPRGQRGHWCATAPELAAQARSLVDAGDVVLVKGSKGIKVSLVVDALRKLGQGASQ